GAQLLVNVDGEDGGTGIEHRGQGTHKCGHKPPCDKPLQAYGQQGLDQHGKRPVGPIDRKDLGVLQGQGKGNDARNQEYKDGQQFQVGPKNGPAPTDFNVVGRK